MKKYLFILSIILFLFPTLAKSHSGDTDASGGHYNRKTGEYHYHNGGSSGGGSSGGSSTHSPNTSDSTIFNKGKISTSVPRGYVSPTPNEKSHPYKKSFSPKIKERDIPSYVSPEAKKARESITNSKTAESDSSLNSRKIGYYFRLANENVGALGCNMKFHERDVSETLIEKVKQRDNNRCVICGSTKNLEVDHRRALMNGGDNSLGNLGILCDFCHAEKTKYDNSLRRKREKVCGKKLVGGTHEPHYDN